MERLAPGARFGFDNLALITSSTGGGRFLDLGIERYLNFVFYFVFATGLFYMSDISPNDLCA